MAALAMVDAMSLGTTPKKRKATEEESHVIREAPAASCCSSNGSSELVKEQVVGFMDLEEEAGSEVETSSTCYWRRESRERSSEESESRVRAMSMECRRLEKFPSESELEDFFAVHEKQIQKRFADKYNYDIGKDKPLEQGRYDWVRLK